MSYDSYVHRARAGAPGAPILFVFHGTGGDENQFFDFGGRLLPEATVISPRGDISEHGAARFFRRKAEGVYDCEDLARATERMSEFVAANRERYGSSTVLGLGFSNGANILANIMIEKPGLFDAGVLMHPLIPFAPKDRKGKLQSRVLITAGQHDPIASVAQTTDLADYFKTQGDTVTLEWHGGGHEIRPNEIEAAKKFFAPYGA
ncbi:Putative esteraselipase/thioesterase protein [Neorhizobium galegae bv. officinalis bv. officinalis str. HAMBI 1141]|uniref:Putative esteraselipase/thioesterase protein n=1 Tax=Neorhizobium galegae bv. officinalis bv. officinalis str. HAMBI 1141 TaxID=1028801 RepID=A0A068TAP8_NEOGA|nr:alpha/beta hydrolase [Neorhizobium galegae]CDN55141.1 Putative esteraselipase/thioesterase protein [Neorhizobium galegae bv. officinalis bv. officinalis str. HAMBI 1141]